MLRQYSNLALFDDAAGLITLTSKGLQTFTRKSYQLRHREQHSSAYKIYRRRVEWAKKQNQ